MTSSCTSSSSSNFFPTRCFFRRRNKWKSLGYHKQQQFVCEFPLDVHLLRWEIVCRNAPRIWRDFGSALPFQTRLTQTKPVLPLSKEHSSQVKDQGRRQCYHNKHKKFPYRPTRDVSLLSGHASCYQLYITNSALHLHSVSEIEHFALYILYFCIFMYLNDTLLSPWPNFRSMKFLTCVCVYVCKCVRLWFYWSLYFALLTAVCIHFSERTINFRFPKYISVSKIRGKVRFRKRAHNTAGFARPRYWGDQSADW